ncbi:MAG TPA: T9SS type A sorting domain-containing protein, partial [Bacteroidia bacterium]|nr:T9SS type A sorting domain-containing protein [Bacteroidia bacterium]
KISSSSMPGTEISAYPNPVSNKLTVELESISSGIYSVELMDLSGRVIYSTQISAAIGFNSDVIDVSDYAKGVYTLSVKNNEGFAKQIRVAVQ